MDTEKILPRIKTLKEISDLGKRTYERAETLGTKENCSPLGCADHYDEQTC